MPGYIVEIAMPFVILAFGIAVTGFAWWSSVRDARRRKREIAEHSDSYWSARR